MNLQKTGAFLKQLRKEKGMTQEQLAEKFYVSSRSVSRWETGSNLPDIDMLVKLADFYEVDIKEIIDGEKMTAKTGCDQNEVLMQVADYSKRKEERLLKKLVLIIMTGIVAWVVSFSFLLRFVNSVNGAGFLLICETLCILLYGTGMFCVKSNRKADSFFNSVAGGAVAIVVSNISLLILFFGNGNYHNYGLAGALYSILILLFAFSISGIVTSIVSKKEQV